MEDKSHAAAAPTVTVDPQDPLPESNWKWRRWFTIASAAVAALMIAAIIASIHQIGGTILDIVREIGIKRDAAALNQSLDTVAIVVTSLANLGFWLIILVLALFILYLVAPSAEQAAKMFATVSAWRSGISTATTARAQSPSGTVEATVQAGPGPQVPAPPAPPRATDILE